MVGLLHKPISQEMHALTLVLNLIESSISFYPSFTATFLLSGENETICSVPNSSDRLIF